ncbi:MAG: hypothetical protein JWP71_585 [Mucilaginibacter sp.]|nr:hypothetical protein [Mucilaginibacter sp.]
MACLLLIGSVIFPLGDFSLTRDLPQMYRNYSKITTSDELGVFDFIGDYLLHGKEIFGHNANDKPQSSGNDVQFQHQPAPFFVVLSSVHMRVLTIPQDIVTHTQIRIVVNTSDFKDKLFRPPLT